MNRLERIGAQIRMDEARMATAATAAKFSKKPVKVVVTGAAGQICYSVLFMIGQGAMLGPDQPIEIRLLDIPQAEKQLKGVEMEILDCAFPLFTKVVATTDYKTAFQDVEIALLIGARPRGPGMERKDLLTANAAIFSGQGKALNDFANPNVKVLVVGNPANTNALIAMQNAPKIPRENFTAMTRLDQNRASSQIATRLGVPVTKVKNVIIWGNHSATQYPDVNHAFIANHPRDGNNEPVVTAVGDEAWIRGEFTKTVQQRGAAIIKARGLSSAASAANAAVDHIRSWVLGTPKGEVVSMGVISDGSYGAPKDVIYSFPCECSGGKWKIVQGLKVDEYSREKMRLTGQELLEERRDALGK